VSAPPAERALQPPPKEPARAARDERRRNTLPFGFPVVRDPATIREPAGLHAAARPSAPSARPQPPPPPSAVDVKDDVTGDVMALAIYERAAPSLTFADSVRAEWQGTANLVHQPVSSAPSAPPPVVTRPPAPISRPRPTIQPRPRLSLEPQSDPRPKLTLEPQSDPMHSVRAEAERRLTGPQLPSSLAPTTSEPEHEMPARGAGLWGDLSVVLASDLRAAQSSSKRVTLIASLGSAALASLLTLWFAHSAAHRAPEAAAASQAQPAAVRPKSELSAAPSVVAAATADVPPAESAAPAPSATAVTPSHPAVVAHATLKPIPSSPPRVVATRPKPAPSSASDSDTASADGNPYSDSSERSQPKLPTAAFKEASAAPTPSADNAAPNAPSGLEDSAKPIRPAATAAPGF
ncbi:MAG TPA: hypothetical protein VNW92_29290, partial [Polyangiaceae bacterium]|nr:hypothetical protein [Polyangiaceae bacterium]